MLFIFPFLFVFTFVYVCACVCLLSYSGDGGEQMALLVGYSRLSSFVFLLSFFCLSFQVIGESKATAICSKESCGTEQGYSHMQQGELRHEQDYSRSV